MRKPKREKCIYRVVMTEFWKASYKVEAVNHGAALVVFETLKQTKSLPKPRRVLLGVIDPPEEVWDEGELVYTNYPPGDDAERMLFLEMWQRMLEAQVTAELAVKAAIIFICRIKTWDPRLMWEEVKARATV